LVARIKAMLRRPRGQSGSVNGFTSQIWYHSWHGDFVQMKDLGG
jgi:hypothetical protein